MEKEEKKTIDLSDYLKQQRTNMVLTLEGDKEQILKIFDEMSSQLARAHMEINELKKGQKEESPKKK